MPGDSPEIGTPAKGDTGDIDQTASCFACARARALQTPQAVALLGAFGV